MVRAPLSVLFLLPVLLAGCVSPMQTVLESRKKGKGLSAEYSAAPEQLWTAIDGALNWSSAGQTEDHRDEGYLLIWFLGANGYSNTCAGVWVEQEGDAPARVTVVSLKQGWTSAMNETEFHRDLSTALGILGQGKLLPLIRPERTGP